MFVSFSQAYKYTFKVKLLVMVNMEVIKIQDMLHTGAAELEMGGVTKDTGQLGDWRPG